MKYAVLYQSNTGNTEKLAWSVFQEINDDDKTIIDLYRTTDIPKADMYFIGFAVYNQSCSLSVLEALSRIEEGAVALFGTCGFYPTEKYIALIEKNMSVWINEKVEYHGLYLCQGRVVEGQQKQFIKDAGMIEMKLREMFAEGNTHPDQRDLENAGVFVRGVLQC